MEYNDGTRENIKGFDKFVWIKFEHRCCASLVRRVAYREVRRKPLGDVKIRKTHPYFNRMGFLLLLFYTQTVKIGTPSFATFMANKTQQLHRH